MNKDILIVDDEEDIRQLIAGILKMKVLILDLHGTIIVLKRKYQKEFHFNFIRRMVRK